MGDQSRITRRLLGETRGLPRILEDYSSRIAGETHRPSRNRTARVEGLRAGRQGGEETTRELLETTRGLAEIGMGLLGDN